MAERRSISRIKPDAMALRALAHPQRMAMLAMLRVDGPATATALGERMGLNSGSASYHLRQLARHGFIEEDTERGNGRERWWRSRHESTSVPEDEDTDPAFGDAILAAHIAQMRDARARRGALSPEWRRASVASDFIIPLNAADAEQLLEKLHAVLWEAMEAAPKLGTPLEEGVEPVTIMLHSFPRSPNDGGAK